MSFGFSVGDFIAAGKLISNIIHSLSDADGSKSEYQELVRELESLQFALRHLDKLQQSGSKSTNLNSIKYAALSCQRPLEQFLNKIKRYEKSLGVWSKEGALRGTAEKLRWAMGKKDDIRKLQSYLNIHVGTINILLAEHGLEMMDLATDKAEADQLYVRETLENTRNIVYRIKDNITAQSLVAQSTNLMLKKLFDMVSGEFRASWKTLGELVTKVWYVEPIFNIFICYLIPAWQLY
jgi:hypothetical protein